jgi:hypothetical protein
MEKETLSSSLIDSPLFYDPPKVPMMLNEPKFDYIKTEAIDEELKCPICLDPFFEPVVLKCCEHTLCKKCADPCNECPLCRRMHKPFTNPPRLIMNMLSQIDVSCQVCCAVVKRDSFPSHVRDVCPIPCPNACGVPQTRAAVESHLELCPYQIVPCEASIVGCKSILRRFELEEHVSKCSIHAQKELLMRIQELEIEVRSQKQIIFELQKSNILSIEIQEELRILAEERVFRRKEEEKERERVRQDYLLKINQNLNVWDRYNQALLAAELTLAECPSDVNDREKFVVYQERAFNSYESSRSRTFVEISGLLQHYMKVSDTMPDRCDVFKIPYEPRPLRNSYPNSRYHKW